MSKMKITPVAYDNESTYREDMISDTVFTASTPFLIISSQPIPKDTNMYFEFEITDYKENPLFRHLPLYVGIHKEPSSGIFATDFSLGSIYYTRRQDFETYEQYNKSAYSAHYKVPTTKSRIPIKGTITGVGVNASRNQITIYSDGKPFYSFRPREFNLNEDGEFYFAVASKVYADITGNINFGTYPMKYRPEGYWDMNQYYVDRYIMMKDLVGSINYSTGNDEVDAYYANRRPIGYDFNSKVDINNIYAPLTNPHLRDTYIQPNLGSSQLYDPTNNDAFVIDSEHQNPVDHAFLPYPIPTDQKIYFELQCKEAPLDPGYIGVPLTVGITKVKDTTDYMGKKEIGNKSFSIDLWHKRYQYHYANVQLGDKEIHYPIRTVYNPIPPMQPDIIGIMLDLKEQTISVYTNHKLFMKADLNEYLGYPDDTRTFISAEKDQIFFNSKDEVYHLFIKAVPDAFTGNGYVIGNFGEPDNPNLRYAGLYDNIDVMTYWYYYNYGIRYLASGDMNCIITTLPYNISVAKTFSGMVYVKSKYDGNDLDFSPGLNMMYGTYNIVTDTERKENVPDLNPFEFHELIYGHRYTEDPYRYDKDLIIFGNVNLKFKDPLNRFISGRFKFTRNFLGKDGNGIDLLTGKNMVVEKLTPKNLPEINGDFYYINRFRINIIQSPNQKIIVTHNGEEHTEPFEIYGGDSISVRIEPINIEDNDKAFQYFTPGTLSYTGGTPTNDMTITATPATTKQFIVGFMPLNADWSPDSGKRLYDDHPQKPVASIRRKKITFPPGVTKVRVYFSQHFWGDERPPLREASSGINMLPKISADKDFFDKQNYDLRDDDVRWMGTIYAHSDDDTRSMDQRIRDNSKANLKYIGLHVKVSKEDQTLYRSENITIRGIGLTDMNYNNWFNTDKLSWSQMPIRTFAKPNINEIDWAPYTTVGVTPGKEYDIICFSNKFKSRTYGFFIYYDPAVVTEDPKYNILS